MPYLGETLAFLTAIIWAIAVILFKKSGETLHPIALNLFKNGVSLVLFIPTLLLFHEPFLRTIPVNDYLLIIISGVVGIGISDTLFFASLNRLGAGLSAVVDCLYSPFIIILSILYLGETMSAGQIIGVIAIISGVLALLRIKESANLTRRNCLIGILLGAAAMAFTAIGVVIVKPLLAKHSLLWLTQMRIVSGSAILGLILLFHPGRRAIVRSMTHLRGWKYAISGAVLGTYLAMLLWLAGIKLTQASTASALNQTSTIFIFIFASLFLKEPLTRQKIISITLAITGALLVTFA